MPVAIVPTIANRINSWSFGERNMFCIFVYRDIKTWDLSASIWDSRISGLPSFTKYPWTRLTSKREQKPCSWWKNLKSVQFSSSQVLSWMLYYYVCCLSVVLCHRRVVFVSIFVFLLFRSARKYRSERDEYFIVHQLALFAEGMLRRCCVIDIISV